MFRKFLNVVSCLLAVLAILVIATDVTDSLVLWLALTVKASAFGLVFALFVVSPLNRYRGTIIR